MEDVKQKSWFSRNWGWVLGGGCLTLIVIVIIGIGGVIYKVADSIKESEPYTHAYAEAVANERVVEYLGTPIETDGMGNTNYKYSNGNTSASLTIPISGPKGKGEIIVIGNKFENEWQYDELYVLINDSEVKINLLDKYLDGI